MVRPKISTAELDRLIGIGLRQTGLVRPSDIQSSQHKVEGKLFRNLYYTLMRRKSSGKLLGRYTNWYGYLEDVHGIRPSGAKIRFASISSPNLRKMSDDELHELVAKGIQRTATNKQGIQVQESNSAKTWHDSKDRISGLQQRVIYQEVAKRKYFNHGSWNEYLEEKHGVPLDQWKWSEERFHRTVAILAQRYPIEKFNWHDYNKQVLYGRSLQTYYQQAHKSKRSKEKPHFFGHLSFKAYVKWAVENYGGDYAERKWKEAVESTKVK